MMKFYSAALLAGALVAGTLAADAKTDKVANLRFKQGSVEAPVHPALKAQAARKAAGKKSRAARRPVVSLAENESWYPTTQVISVWEGEWFDVEKYTTTWNAAGKPLVNIVESLEEGVEEYTKEVCVYDDYGYMTSKVTSNGASLDDLQESSRVSRGYDPVVHHLVTSNMEEMYNDQTSQWMQTGNVYRRIVTRDGAGNITSVEVQTYFDGRWDPDNKYDIEYGADGKASKISYSVMQYDETYHPTDWMTRHVYDHIEWYCTDGQIYDMDCIYEGANKVKTFSQMVGDEVACVSTVNYVGDSDDYVLVGDMGWAIYTLTWTNHEYGGYTSYTVQVDTEVAEGEEPYTEKNVSILKSDELGNSMLDVHYSIYGDELYMDIYTKGEDVLDGEGRISEYTMAEFYPLEEEPAEGEEEWYAVSRATDDELLAPLDAIEGEWENYIKVVFSDYQPAQSAALDRIDAEIADGKAEYFTIDGRRVNGTPAAGLYIRRTAVGTTKVLVK